MPTFKVIHTADPKYGTGGKYHDAAALETVIRYCLNPAKTPHGYVGGMGVSPNQAAFEMELLARAYGQADKVLVRHFILSFSQEEAVSLGLLPCEKLYHIAWRSASFYGQKHQILFAVHEKLSQPHIHFVMNRVNFLDGTMYRGKKDDYYRFQNFLQEFLWQEYGLLLKTVSDHV